MAIMIIQREKERERDSAQYESYISSGPIRHVSISILHNKNNNNNNNKTKI